MGPRRKSLNFLTLKKTSKLKVNENDFLHCVSDYRARVTKRKSTGTMKSARVSLQILFLVGIFFAVGFKIESAAKRCNKKLLFGLRCVIYNPAAIHSSLHLNWYLHFYLVRLCVLVCCLSVVNLEFKVSTANLSRVYFIAGKINFLKYVPILSSFQS